MKHLITLLLSLCSIMGVAQTVTNPPSGSKPYGTPAATPDGEIMVGRNGSYTYITRKAYTDSLTALGYTKGQVDALLAGYVPTSRTINGKALSASVNLTASDVGAVAPGDDVSDLNNDAGYITEADILVTSVNGQTGDVSLAANDIGLGNVDNTSDLNKPISTATQDALDGKEDLTNKVTSLSSPNNTTYPTTEAVANAISDIPTPEYTASNGIQIVSEDISPVYGTTAGTVAQGNDTRLNNGQTAYNSFVSRNISNAGYSVEETGVDLNSFIPGTMVFAVDQTSTNVPWVVGVNNGIVIQGDAGGGTTRNAQIALPISGAGWRGNMYFRNRRGDPWYRLWSNYDFNISDYIPLAQKSAAGGVASLDGNGKVPVSQLPTTGMQYQGTWNANTNSPTISDATGTDGYFYRVTVGGTQNLGSGSITFSVGDDVIHNGSFWQRAPSGTTSTNLSLGTRTASTIPINNSNGSGVTIPSRTSTLAGLMTPSDLSTLNSAIQSETDPTVANYIKNITNEDISEWNTAYGWGDHSIMRYIRADGTGTFTFGYGDGADNLNTVVRYLNGASTGLPGNVNGHIFSMAVSSNINAQFAVENADNPNAYLRTKTGGSYNSWVSLWHSGNFNPSSYTIPWTRVTGKPSTFTPSAHTHNASDINSGTLSMARIPTGTSGSTVAVGNHTHPASDITSGTISSDRIGNGSISNSKLASQAAYTLKGRMGGDGAPQNITMTNLKDMLGLQYFSNTITTPLNLAVGNSVTQNYGVSGLDGNEVVMVSPSGTLNWVNGLTIQARATLNNVSVTVINSTSSNLGAQREIEFNVLIFDPDGIF